MVTLRPSYKSYLNEYFCISTDEKPVGGDIKNGSTLREIDTRKKYMYDAEHQTWLEVSWIPDSSGSGGGDGSSSGDGSCLPSVTSADDGKALIVDNGQWVVDHVDLGYSVSYPISTIADEDIDMEAYDNGDDWDGIYYTYIPNYDEDWSELIGLRITIDGGEPITIYNNNDYAEGTTTFGQYDDNGIPILTDGSVACQCYDNDGIVIYAADDHQSVVIEKISKEIETSDEFQDAVNSAVNTPSLLNIVDGAKSHDQECEVPGSVRGILAAEEDDNYVLGSASAAFGYDTKADGYYAFAEGYSTTAQGDASHAEGYGTKASGFHSHAEGKGGSYTLNNTAYNSGATGNYSHTEGDTTIASQTAAHAEGTQTRATANSAHAEGSNSVASGGGSHAEGGSTIASGARSHAEGSGTTASGEYSHAEGSGTTANSGRAHAEGSGTTASGADSHAEGYNTYTWGTASHAEGGSTRATGNYSHAEGSGTNATGQYCHAEGLNTTSSGGTYGGSHAEGGTTTASANYAHAEGHGSTASGPVSHAEGGSTEASGNYSHAEGEGTIANHGYQHVFGQYNVADASSAGSHLRGNYVEIVGNGTNTNNRSNARTLDWNGNEVLAGNLTITGGSLTLGSTTFTAASIGGGVGLPSVTSSDNGKALIVENGVWSVDDIDHGYRTSNSYTTVIDAANITSSYSGSTSDPSYIYVIQNSSFPVAVINDAGKKPIRVTIDAGSGAESYSFDPVTYNGYDGVATYGESIVVDASDGPFGLDPDFTNAPVWVRVTANNGLTSVYIQQSYVPASTEIALKIEYIYDVSVVSNDFALAVNTIMDGRYTSRLVNGVAQGSIRHVDSSVEGNGYWVGDFAFVAGAGAKASGYCAFAENAAEDASGYWSHAEGSGTTASGRTSHAEGENTIASGQAAHTEGRYTTGSQNCAHAEGYQTNAGGTLSHTEGLYTVANHQAQHVFGTANIADDSTAEATGKGKYIEIVGNGTVSSNWANPTIVRSNARTLDWSGNEVLSGGLTVGAAGITIGSTTITEAQLQSLLAMLS